MAINLKTVISELQFIDRLATDNKADPRLPDLLAHAKTDLAAAAKDLANDPIIGSRARRPQWPRCQRADLAGVRIVFETPRPSRARQSGSSLI
jgi:hypothetical protein